MSALRLVPPLALSACAIGWIVSSLRSLPAPLPVVVRPPVLDWNDAGAFVVDPRGIPLAGAHVAAIPKLGWVTDPATVVTDACGYFELPVRAVYELRISFAAADTETLPPRLFARVVEIAPPFFGQRFVLAPTTRYALHVQDDDGEPVRFHALELRRHSLERDLARTRFGPVWSARKTDERGDLVVWSVPGVAAEFYDPRDEWASRRLRSGALRNGGVVFGPILAPLVVER